MKLFRILPLIFASILCACGNDIDNGKEEVGNKGDSSIPLPKYDEIRGADISWLQEMEDQGIKFHYDNGIRGDCIEILKSVGINTCRFRLWVDPESKYNSTPEVIKQAARAQIAGMRIMLDLHYSDSWADPSQQTVPKQWQNLNLYTLANKVEEYTKATMQQFKDAGIEPAWVQIGNETGNGMLWPYGKAEQNPAGYARLNNAGYNGLKSVFPNAMAIVHIHNGQDAGLFDWIIGLLKANGGKFDAIGMSLYPEPTNYVQMVNDTRANMQRCISKYSCPVLLCEVGMGEAYVSECRDFLTLCLNLKNDLGDNYLGVAYWEPQCFSDWNGYRKGAFDSSGAPTAALKAFK